ncbi:hypothetical protein F2P56_025358 [Juglans regia]|uniref:Kinesin motor domain-containing protein n=2 Tax=Juglans regia TaxID=51240 RepID=A0A833UCY6_JUGRE|nr:kinesin-like protein KIN-7E [Juglans regia]KAF5455823.1 hypothetical protein F2P56_025358 [Juglans regia]
MSEQEVVTMQGRDMPRWSGQEERIFVSVRVRPLNEKETASNDVIDWECINNNAIRFKHTLPDRAMFPTAYTFDRVFGTDSPTKKVYEEGARDVALSAVGGINSSIFAYGQTSSGKTYTMTGITEHAMADIYDYIDGHKEREFVLKFSAMEIYNEAVRDLLRSDGAALRLLDDPEKGTVVERLTEVTLRDWKHLQELLAVCEAERKIGETSLNETSSRSHQILRLTIESSAREYIGARNSRTLAAQLNFVDLAGSERTSQTLAAGTRLKEGAHINRSLLTLGTVIRKLSKGRTGHIPYRDSKLTRILQNSLGGNARTAIVCTMSPARSHVEQSRNTLLFANCAKEVTTNAQVNVLMTDKALVKQLQRELARLEGEMKNLAMGPKTTDVSALLKEKDLKIEKMDQEIQELTRQCELARARAETRRQLTREDQVSGTNEYPVLEPSALANPCFDQVNPRTCRPNYNKHYQQFAENPENFLWDIKSSSPDPYEGWEETAGIDYEKSEDSCKEVRCIEVDEPRMDQKIEAPLFLSSPEERIGHLFLREVVNADAVTSPQKGPMEEMNEEVMSPQKRSKKATDEDAVPYPHIRSENITNEDAVSYPHKRSESFMNEDAVSYPHIRSEKITNEDAVSYPQKRSESFMNEDALSSPENGSRDPGDVNDSAYDDLKQKIQSMQKAISCLISFCPSEQSPSHSEANTFRSRSMNFGRSRSCRAVVMPIRPAAFEDLPGRPACPQKTLSAPRISASYGNLSRKDSQISLTSAFTEAQNSDKSDDSEDARSVLSYATVANEEAHPQSKKRFGDLVRISTAPANYDRRNNGKDAGWAEVQGALQPGSNWYAEFERQRREIIELWDECNVPLVHRTYFFLLFEGDPSDAVYMEVELRRLSFLKATFSHGTLTVNKSETLTPASSAKALHLERKMLSRKVQKKFSKKERERLYQRWGIGLNSKRRSLQLACCLWTETKDMDHLRKSAALVAGLVGKPGQACKETFGLSFLSQQPVSRKSFPWKHGLSYLS